MTNLGGAPLTTPPVALFRLKMGNRRRRGSVPECAAGGTRLFTAKIWNLGDVSHHEEFLARLFHAATRRDKGKGHRGSIGYEHTRNAQTRSGRWTPGRDGGHRDR